MTRRFFHLLMFIALIVSIASLIHTTLTRSEPCPLCGGRTDHVGAYRRLDRCQKVVATSHIHRCPACDYEFTTP